MERVQKARLVLKESPEVSTLEREQIVAFATLRAYCDHFSLSPSFEDAQLLDQWKHILDFEYERYLKQRRIALAELSREI